MLALQISNLRKNYGTLQALRGIDLEIPTGQFFGLLGPNGAGKTTLIKIIVGLAHATSGQVSVFGHDIRKEPILCRSFLGVSPQEPNVDRFFQVRKILEFHGGYYGMGWRERRQRTREVLERFHLTDKTEASYWKLSGGMQKRVMIARSVMTRPKILILDEPTAGVDVEQRHQLWGVLRDLKRDGTTIILTTHYIDEAEELCERVAVIDHGQIVETGTPAELIAKHCQKYIEVRGKKFSHLTVEDLMAMGNSQGIAPGEIRVREGSLEEVFLKLTGHSINE